MGNRRRTKRIGSKAVECTCELRYELEPLKHADHEGLCDLWHLQDFVDGLIDWDAVEQKLVVTGWGEDTFADTWDDDDIPTAASDLQAIIDATVSGYNGTKVSGYSYGGGGKFGWNYVSCRHNMTEVVLPDEAGTKVYCSASTDARGRINRPDYAVYLFGGWSADSIATFVPWQDYGVPTVPWRQVRAVAEDFYARARRGERVEVGCMGGHGRTGTFLAAVVMLADPNMSPAGAVAWVRVNYCHKAVEDVSQEYFLKWIADPSLPASYVYPVTKKPAATVTVLGDGGGCERMKRGKWCNKVQDHAGPHHYTLTTCGPIVAAPAAVAPYEAQGDIRCIHVLSGGTYRCRFETGHQGYHAYTAVTIEPGVSAPAATSVSA